MANKIHGYAEAALSLYKGKLIEVNTGETATTQSYAEVAIGQKHVVRGILDDAIGDGLVLICSVNGHKQKVLINVWSIISVMELCGYGHTCDVYIDEYKDRFNKRRNRQS